MVRAQEVFLRTKVRVFRPHHDVIERSRLNAAREESLRIRLTTLTAPGGFGKSTLVASWVMHWQTQGHHCTWLSLTHEDDEPARFLYCLVQVMRQLGQGVGDSANSLLRGRPLAAPRTVLSLLINDLEQFEGEAVAVLDDYQWIHDESIHDAVSFLISHAPPHFHLLITSRISPPLSLARLRAHGEWLDIDATSLRFDEEETTRFLKSACSKEPTQELITSLHVGTDGWAAALRLAALSQSLSSVLETNGSSTTSVFANLIEDLLEGLPADTVRFMAKTAVLERLNAELCDAVCDEGGGAERIEQLLHYNLLLEPLDSDGKCLRYHQLLREYLNESVSKRLGIDQQMVHRKAAQWFANQRAWTDAVRHALQAGDTEQAVEWLANCCMELVRSGDLLTLLSWRRQFSPELLKSQTKIQISVAWGLTLAMRFSEAESLIDEIEVTVKSIHAGQNRPEALGECLAIRAVIVALQDDSTRANEIAELWRDHFDSGDAFTRNVMSNVMRYVHWKSGNLLGVYEQPWSTSSYDDEQYNAFSTVYRHTLLGNVELEKSRLGLAERHARRALRMVEAHAGVHSVSAALVTPLMAMLNYQQGRVMDAEALLHPLMPLIDNTAMFESVIQAYQVLVRSAQLDGRYGNAFELLERAEAIGYNQGWDRLVASMLLERIRLLLIEGRLEEANAICIRLTRMAEKFTAAPRCARSEILVFRDIGLARLAFSDQRIGDARRLLSDILVSAQSMGKDLRSIQIGTFLSITHMALADQEACFAELRRVLQAAYHSGAIRSVLDEGEELQRLLPRFLISKECDAELGNFVQRLVVNSRTHQKKIGESVVNSVLTEREADVIKLVARGQSNKEIAREMNISAETVKTHLKNMFEKLGVQQRSQAVLMARSLGLLPD